MAELIVLTTAMTTSTAVTTTAASDPLPADLQSIDWNALFAEHQALLNANNPAVGMNAIHGVEGEVDIEQVINEPPVNEEGFNEIMGDLDAILGVNAEEAQMQPNILLQAIQEADIDVHNIPAGDLDAILAVPPDDQNAENEMMAELNQLDQPEGNQGEEAQQ